MEKTANFYDTWLKTQENFIGSLMENTKKIQAMLSGMKVTDEESDTAGMFNLYNTWANAVFCSVNETRDANMAVIKDTLSKTLGSTNVYTKLYEVWLPIFKALQEKTLSAETYQELLDPEKYREVMDKVFGFNSGTAEEIYGQATKLMEAFSLSAQQFMKPWSEASLKSQTALPQFLEGHPESLIAIFHTLFNAFDSTVGRVFHVPAVGKDREKVEMILRCLDDLSVYMAKNIEYQHMMYVTGMTAMEKVIDTIAQKIKEGSEIKSFDEFLNLWMDVNEKTYYALFQTEDFSRAQGALLDASLKVRQHFFKLMELYLYDFPIALRSEMDDLYRVIYELKKKVKKLEKQLSSFSSQEVNA